MSNVIRIANTGIFYANSFDEVTFNANTIYGTNYVPNSQNFSGWNGPGNTYSISNTVPAPDGTFTATLAIPTTTNNYKGLTYGITFNSPGTLSLFVKPRGTYTFFSLSNGPNATTYFNLAAGTTSGPGPGWASSSITPYPNGWYRLSVTQTSTQSWGTLYLQLENNSQSYTFAGDGVNGYYIWGAQLEINLTPTIYKPTNASGGPLYNTAQKIDSNGNVYIAGAYDEVSGSSITNGLTLYLDAKVYDSQTYNRNTWPNLSPKNVNVTLKNVGYNSANGGYFTFQGGSSTDYYINTNLPESSFITQSAGTVSVWVLPTGASPSMGGSSYAGGQHIWGESDNHVGGGDDYIWIVRGIRNGVDAIYCGLWDNTFEHFVAVPYTVNQWINITWLHTNNTLYGYANGQLVGSVTANNILNTGITTYIGGCPTYNPGITGYIGKVQAYNRALSPAEIQINYNADAARFNLTPIGPQSVQRILSTGDTYISGNYDEWTGVPVVDSSLVLWLDAGQPASSNGLSTIWKDLSGNGYNPTNNYYITPPVPSGANGLSPYDPIYGAYYFNNVLSNPIQPNCYNGFYLNQGSSNNQLAKMLTNSFTFEIWVKHTAWNNRLYGGSFPISQDNSYGVWEQYGTTGYRFGSFATSLTGQGQPNFYTNQSGGTLNLSAGQNIINLNQWYNITVTFNATSGNSGTGSMYINGVLYNTATGTYYPTTSGAASNFTIGTNADGCGSFTGEMSVYKWYSRALSASEVNTNFNALRNRYGI